MPTIESHIQHEVRRNDFSRIIATVSGGADSVALLSALMSSKAEIIAAHCNFHLRGEESMRDQRHVEKICHTLGVTLHIKHFNVDEYRNNNPGTSVEMACRNLRYEWFATLAEELHADRIATGHNADDNIETLFLNLMRGSGTSGLKGILPDNGKIWRPLLSFHRHEIEQYLRAKGLAYITDSSNLCSDYRRNFLRNEVLPLLKTRWPGLEKSLARSVELLRRENKVVDAMVASHLPAPGISLSTETIKNFPDKELLVRRYIEPLGPFTTTASEIIAAIDAAKPAIRRWKLRRGTVILRNYQLIDRKSVV